ncbi:hypothetical protein GW931_00910 [archaeon]|nr:hypothetical protein [archaeon]
MDRVDRKIINLLSERFKISREIIKFKKKNKIKVKNRKREEEIVEKLAKKVIWIKTS